MSKIVSIRINLKLEMLDDIKIMTTPDQQISFLKEKTGEEFRLDIVPCLFTNNFESGISFDEKVLAKFCGQTSILTNVKYEGKV